LLVNDRMDVALACGLDGVHLPADRPAPQSYRAVCERHMVIGVSCHTIEEVRRAAAEGADFALLGPIFSTPGKGPPIGLGPLKEAARESVPVLALGGITLENARACMDAGAAGIAAIRLFEQAGAVADVVKELRR
jgi:thiamine-phosphate pyrophosphorylase